MTRIAVTAALLLALLGANYWQYTQIQEQSERAATAESNAADRLITIKQLKDDITSRQIAQQDLENSQRSLKMALTESEQFIKELARENEQYRNWSDNDLPDAVQRLRERPAFTSARDYQQWLLSRADTLPFARDSPGN